MTPLFSTAYLPPIGLMAAMVRCGSALVEAKETFPKQTYRNRALVMTAAGPRPLIVPTLRRNHSRTDAVLVDHRDRWATVHFRTLQAAYAASPYWEHYADELHALLAQKPDRLIDLNTSLTAWLLRKFKSPCTLALTTDFLPPTGNPHDFRYRFSPKADPTPMPPYWQVFAATRPFAPDLSAVDLLMNLGPDAPAYLRALA